MILFRTYNPEARCVHADSETVLVVESYADVLSGYCARCLHEELARRHAARGEVDQ